MSIFISRLTVTYLPIKIDFNLSSFCICLNTLCLSSPLISLLEFLLLSVPQYIKSKFFVSNNLADLFSVIKWYFIWCMFPGISSSSIIDILPTVAPLKVFFLYKSIVSPLSDVNRIICLSFKCGIISSIALLDFSKFFGSI